jgi:hypothetical protein
MMSSKKNQHFVPRHYLRRFSFDGGSRIHLMLVPDAHFKKDAPLKSQCSRNFFYGQNSTVEDQLSQLEGEAEYLFKEICDRSRLPKESAKRTPLFLFINIMRSRTEHFDNLRQSYAQVVIQEVLAMKMRQQGRQDILRMLPDIKWTNKDYPAHNVASAITTALLLCDLKLKLLLAPNSQHFIASDHPVVVLNQAFYDIVKGQSVAGITMRGLQVFLPLSPEIAIMAFDSQCYRVGKPDGDPVQLRHPDDVRMINALQVLNCHRCIYFRDEEDRGVYENLILKSASKRVVPGSLTSVKDVVYEGQKGLLINGRAPSLPVPGKWSFCKVRRVFLAEDFIPREPNTVRAVEEWEKEIWKRKKWMSFDDWADEYCSTKNRSRNDRSKAP